MVQSVHAHAGSSAQARPRRFGFAWGSRPSTSRPAAVVSDEQILALVVAAERLSQRRRNRYLDIGTEAADERLVCLDWTARSGRLVLAERAARVLIPSETPASGAAQPRRRR